MSGAEQLVPDELWQAIEPLLPPKRPQPRVGRPWIGDRAVLGGIVYLLRTGVPWRLLPAQELGCGSPVTCWRRLHDWQAAGVWTALQTRLLDWLGDDGSDRLVSGPGGQRSSTSEKGGPLTGPNPVDQGNAGSTYHLLTDARGLPLAIALSAANTHDWLLLEPQVDAVPVVGPRG